MGFSFKPAVVKAVAFGSLGEHAVDDIELLQQDGKRLFGTVGRRTLALGIGVGLQCLLQLVGDTYVIHNQPTWLVLKYPVHTGDRLHQVVALHRLIDVQGVAAWGVESC